MNVKFDFKLKNILGWLICFIPFILIYSRSIADIIVVIVCLYFLFIKIRDRDYRWINEPWIKIGFIVLAICQNIKEPIIIPAAMEVSN